MKTLDDYKDDVCEALGCDDRSDLHREHVSGCFDVDQLLTAREAFAAGLAQGRDENPRCVGCGQIHGPCKLCPSGFCSAHQPVEGIIENLSRELTTAVVFIADNCNSEAATALVKDLSGYQVVADAIARRGKEGA